MTSLEMAPWSAARMSAEPLEISKSSFRIGQLNSMILRGRRLREIIHVAFSAPAEINIIWVNLSVQDPVFNGRYTLISGMPMLISGDITPGMLIYGEVTISLKSRGPNVRSLRVPAFYSSP